MPFAETSLGIRRTPETTGRGRSTSVGDFIPVPDGASDLGFLDGAGGVPSRRVKRLGTSESKDFTRAVLLTSPVVEESRRSRAWVGI